MARKIDGKQLQAHVDDARRGGEQAFGVWPELRVHRVLCKGVSAGATL
jgi:hypothetical protein